jgi:hypothetical protein
MTLTSYKNAKIDALADFASGKVERVVLALRLGIPLASTSL